MSETLYPYYERELIFIRQLGQDFARQYPPAAGRLLLEPNRSVDPHVERLIESFALLAGRVHQKLDDAFPELTEALLNTLYPHYLAPVPSMAIVQFELDAARARLPKGYLIDKGSQLLSQPVDDLSCKFRTAYPVTLWPVRLAEASLVPPPFPAGLATPPRAPPPPPPPRSGSGSTAWPGSSSPTCRSTASGSTSTGTARWSPRSTRRCSTSRSPSSSARPDPTRACPR